MKTSRVVLYGQIYKKKHRVQTIEYVAVRQYLNRIKEKIKMSPETVFCGIGYFTKHKIEIEHTKKKKKVNLS
jgi:hypothetical protein